MSVFHRVWNALRPNRLHDEIREELEAHLSLLEEEEKVRGLEPADARVRATQRFGNTGAYRDETRDVDTTIWLDRFLQDLRYAARGLRRKPGFALVIIMSLSLGIGANTAIFSVLNAVLLRPLPVAHPEEVFALDITESKFRAPERFSYPLFEQMRTAVGGEVAAMSRVARMYGRVGGEREQDITRVQLVSGEYFSLLGLAPARGRLLTPSDNLAIGLHPVAVVSHAFWQRKLISSEDVIGRTINLNGAQFTVIGVAPATFNGLWLESPVDVWIPLMMQAAAHYQQNFNSSNAEDDKPWPNQEGISWLDVIVRTRRSLPTLQGVFHQWLEGHAGQISAGIDRQLFLQQRLLLDPLTQGYSMVRGQIEGPLYALSCMVALVLLIACANTANLILSRASSRQREIAVRLSIGASRARVIRQLLTETFLLVAIAAGAGVVAAHLASGLLVRTALGFSSGASPVTAGLDWRVGIELRPRRVHLHWADVRPRAGITGNGGRAGCRLKTRRPRYILNIAR